MGRFSYVARTKDGKKESGIVDVPSEEALIGRLQEKGLLVVKVTSLDRKQSEAGASSSKQAVKRFTHRRVKLYDLVFFARQLATLLDSGITIHKSLDTLMKQIDSRMLYDVTAEAKRGVEEGLTLKDALARHPKIFSDLWINLIESGEASGNLALVLDRLAKYLEMQANFRRKIVSALIYPALLFFVATAAILFFVIKIVPTFANLFESFGAELPVLTQMLVELSVIIRKGFFPGLGVLFLIVFAYKKFNQNPSGKRVVDGIKIKLPVFGNFFKVLAIERFTSEMATLIEGGVPILYALEITERSVGNKVLEGIIRSIKTNVREGRPLAELLDKSNFFEPLVVQMISVGEEVGELAKMFRRVANFYDEYVETFVSRFATIFEPIMLLFMGGVIGVMLVALFLPIFSMVNMASSTGSGL